MNRFQVLAARRVWLIIFGALCFSVLIYVLLGYFIEHGSKPRVTNPATVATMTPILVPLAGAMLIASIAWLRFRVDGKMGGEGRDLVLLPGQFQSDSIVALALSEACTILGLMLFFMGAPLKELAFFALATLFVNFAFILPRGLQFWTAYIKKSSV